MDAAQTVSSPTPALRKKLSSARAQAERKVLRRTDSIFMSDKDVSDQAFDPVAEEFDRKLRGL